MSPTKTNQGLFLHYHANTDTDTQYDAGDTLDIAPDDAQNLGLTLDNLRQESVLLGVAQSLEAYIEEHRRQVVRVTSMQIGYADPRTALRVFGVQISPATITQTSPRLWSEVEGSHVADYKELRTIHPHSSELNVVWHRWMHQQREPSTRTEPKRILFLPQPDGETCRLHPIKDEDLLFTPKSKEPLQSVASGSSSLSAKVHAFRKGQDDYDAGLTVAIPKELALALASDGQPWSQDTLQVSGRNLLEHIASARHDIDRITSLRLLSLDESTRTKILSFTVVSPQVRASSPIVWPVYPQTRVEDFNPQASYARHVMLEWQLTRGKEGQPPYVIAVPRPKEGVHMHPMAEEDVQIPMEDTHT